MSAVPLPPSRPSEWRVGHFYARVAQCKKSLPINRRLGRGHCKNARRGGHYTQLLKLFRSAIVFSIVTQTRTACGVTLREGC